MDNKEILANADSISLDAAAAGDHNRLCDIWPIVKEGLEILAKSVKNAGLKAIIGIIISIGDVVIGKICG